MSLKSLSYRDRNTVIRAFFLKNQDKGKGYTVKHFIDTFEMKETTVRRILKQIEEDPSDEGFTRKKGSGRPKALKPTQARAVLASIENKVGASTKKAAGRYGVSDRTIQRTLHRLNSTCPKRRAAPDISDDQHIRIKDRCSLLSNNFFPVGGRVAIVIDDESLDIFFSKRCYSL